jgi:hypothetical protein
VSISVNTGGLEHAEQEMAAKTARITSALYKKIFSLCIQVQSKVQGNLAQGIGLKSRHGTAGLAGSVRANEPTIEGTVVTGTVEGGGGPFWYGAMWERTGHGEIVPVTKKVLSWLADGKRVFAMRVSAQGPRPWMVPPFNEMQPYIREQIDETVRLAAAGDPVR